MHNFKHLYWQLQLFNVLQYSIIISLLMLEIGNWNRRPQTRRKIFISQTSMEIKKEETQSLSSSVWTPPPYYVRSEFFDVVHVSKYIFTVWTSWLLLVYLREVREMLHYVTLSGRYTTNPPLKNSCSKM